MAEGTSAPNPIIGFDGAAVPLDDFYDAATNSLTFSTLGTNLDSNWDQNRSGTRLVAFGGTLIFSVTETPQQLPVDPLPSPTPTPSTPVTKPAPITKELVATGSTAEMALIAGVGVFLVGVALLVVARRRGQSGKG